MKEKMKSLLKNCFGTTKRTVVTIVCIVAAVALLGTVTAYAAVRGTAIGEETAQNYAFADAGVDPAAAANIQTEFSYESGQFVYDIEFTADDTEYEYWIKASDGTVVKKAMEIVTLDGTTATVTAAITLEEAKTIAFADAGVNEDEVTIVKAELDYDDGLSVYDVEFYVENVEYEYEVNANTGAIYSKSKETKVAAETNAETGNTTEAALDEAAVNTEATANTEITTEETVTNTGTTETATGNTDNPSGTNNGTNSTTGDTTDGSASSGTTGGTTTTQITLAEAKKIALADAGVSASDVTYTKAKLDTDDGVAVYDIEFTTSTKEYDYEIKAADGTILDKDVETIKTSSTGSSTTNNTTSGTTGSTSGTTGGTSGTTTTQITLAEAKKIALADAGVSASDVTYTKAKLDTDDGVAVYDIEFTTSTKEYDYEIKAADGTILDKDVETIKTSTESGTTSGTTGNTSGTTNSGTTSGTTNSGTTSGTTTTTQITLDEAKAAALKDAGLSSSNVTYTKAKLDTDDGVAVYDIEFYTSTKEYEYEIKASDGTILDKSVETIKTSSTGSGTTSGTTGSTSGTTTTQITLDEAKKVALKDAGLSSSDVTYTKAKKDTDDGVTVYDIEFYTSTKEYEYEIKASDGTILDKSVEAIKTNSTTNSGSTSGTTSTTDSSYISLDEAKTIALNKAGVSASEVTFEKAKLEKDDGIMVYELEFYKGNMEYECTVNATTGAIIDYEVDVDD